MPWQDMRLQAGVWSMGRRCMEVSWGLAFISRSTLSIKREEGVWKGGKGLAMTIFAESFCFHFMAILK